MAILWLQRSATATLANDDQGLLTKPEARWATLAAQHSRAALTRSTHAQHSRALRASRRSRSSLTRARLSASTAHPSPALRASALPRCAPLAIHAQHSRALRASRHSRAAGL